MTIRIMLWVLFAALASCAAKPPSNSPEKVQPKVVANFEGYSEGVILEAGGVAYVSLLHKEAVYRIQTSGAPTIWYRVNEPNGHKILQDGTHMIAARGGIHHVTPDGRLLKIFDENLVTPNDLAIDGDGGVYVSAPAPAESDQQKRLSGIYYLDSKRSVHRAADGFCYPNGIVVRPDGRSLLVNDSCTRQVSVFQISSPGTVTDQRVFAELPEATSVPDGMTFDQDGRLYVADYGSGDVIVFDVNGRLLARYSTGMHHASNVTFGGPNLENLYVTGAPIAEDGVGQLVVLDIGVRGRSSLAMPASASKN
jgi:gluconolactonase